MYGIFTYIWFIFMVDVARYAIHGSSGIYIEVDFMYSHGDVIGNQDGFWIPNHL